MGGRDGAWRAERDSRRIAARGAAERDSRRILSPSATSEAASRCRRRSPAARLTRCALLVYGCREPPSGVSGARGAGRHAAPRWSSHHDERARRASPTRGAPRARGCPDATRRELGADRSCEHCVRVRASSLSTRLGPPSERARDHPPRAWQPRRPRASTTARVLALPSTASTRHPTLPRQPAARAGLVAAAAKAAK
jgi:hypothetical protein